MRLFQQQVVTLPSLTPGITAVPPPFLPDQEEKKGVTLLRESTRHLQEGRHRLPTPKRAAIMRLSSSFQKRRLRKQQQILSDVAQRCREQEVADLSSKLTTKLGLQNANGDGQAAQLPAAYIAAAKRLKSRGNLGDVDLSGGVLSNRETIERREYKFFPARKIMKRQPSRLAFLQMGSTLGYVTSRSTTSGYSSHKKNEDISDGTRMTIDFVRGMMSKDPASQGQILAQQAINRNEQRKHCTSPELTATAPLLLPDLHLSQRGTRIHSHNEANSSPYFNDRLDSYLSSSRLTLEQRGRMPLDASSISGSSYRGHHLTLSPIRGNGQPPAQRSRDQVKSVMSDQSTAATLGETQAAAAGLHSTLSNQPTDLPREEENDGQRQQREDGSSQVRRSTGPLIKGRSRSADEGQGLGED